MLDIAFPPGYSAANGDPVYAAAAGGGVWKWRANSQSWEPLLEEYYQQPVGGLAVSSVDDQIIVAATGEGHFVESYFYSGVGILRSTNGGSSWNTTTVDAGPWIDAVTGLAHGMGFHFVECGPPPPEGNGTFLAGATDGLYRSTDEGASWALVFASVDSTQFYDALWKPVIATEPADTVFEDSEEISVIERHFVMVKHRRQKYRCRCNANIVTAPGPLKLQPSCRYSIDFAVGVAIAKYLDHAPLERQVRIMRREGLRVDSQTLWDQLNTLAHHLEASYEAVRERVLSFPLVHADETSWRATVGLGEEIPTTAVIVWTRMWRSASSRAT